MAGVAKMLKIVIYVAPFALPGLNLNLLLELYENTISHFHRSFFASASFM